MKPLEQISVTEISSFRECRRRWYLGTHIGYQPKSERIELWFGDLMHSALQVWAEKGLKKALRTWYKLFDEALPAVQRSYGGLWEGMEETYREYRELGAGMLTNYEIFYEALGVKMENVHLEQRVWVPIRDINGKDTSVKLTARMDRVIGIDDDHYILDYKTGSQPSGKALELADQPTGYSYIFFRVSDELPRGVFIEALLKKLPDEPRILQNGELSTAKNQNTLPVLYESKMREMGLMRSAKHQECLAALQAQGWDGYFEREMTQRNYQHIMSYERHLAYIVKDMQAVVKNPELAYPSPSQMRCPRCPFLNVCLAMEDGSDYEHMLETQFEINSERRW